MTKDKLEAYRAAAMEMVLLERELALCGQVRDSVKGSLPEHPYTLQHIAITGITPCVADMLRARRDHLAKLRLEVEQFLATVADPYMALLLRLRYVKGLPWEQVASEMGYGYTCDGLKQAVGRFLKRCTRA